MRKPSEMSAETPGSPPATTGTEQLDFSRYRLPRRRWTPTDFQFSMATLFHGVALFAAALSAYVSAGTCAGVLSVVLMSVYLLASRLPRRARLVGAAVAAFFSSIPWLLDGLSGLASPALMRVIGPPLILCYSILETPATLIASTSDWGTARILTGFHFWGTVALLLLVSVLFDKARESKPVSADATHSDRGGAVFMKRYPTNERPDAPPLLLFFLCVSASRRLTNKETNRRGAETRR